MLRSRAFTLWKNTLWLNMYFSQTYSYLFTTEVKFITKVVMILMEMLLPILRLLFLLLLLIVIKIKIIIRGRKIILITIKI